MITKKSHDSLEILNDYIQNLNKNKFVQKGERGESGEGGEGGVWRRKAKCPEEEEEKEEKEKEKEKKFTDQSKVVHEVLADQKNPCFVDDDDDTGAKGRGRI